MNHTSTYDIHVQVNLYGVIIFTSCFSFLMCCFLFVCMLSKFNRISPQGQTKENLHGDGIEHPGSRKDFKDTLEQGILKFDEREIVEQDDKITYLYNQLSNI